MQHLCGDRRRRIARPSPTAEDDRTATSAPPLCVRFRSLRSMQRDVEASRDGCRSVERADTVLKGIALKDTARWYYAVFEERLASTIDRDALA